MAEDTDKHLAELLQSFDTAMLITRHGEGEHARPMAVARVDGSRTIWFVTSTDSPKADELREDGRVAVTFQGKTRYAALSGRARLVRDRAKIEELWKSAWKVWFPNGKDDPALALVRVEIDDAEFWDNAGAKGVRYAFEAARALVTGSTPSPSSGQHGREKRIG